MNWFWVFCFSKIFYNHCLLKQLLCIKNFGNQTKNIFFNLFQTYHLFLCCWYDYHYYNLYIDNNIKLNDRYLCLGNLFISFERLKFINYYLIINCRKIIFKKKNFYIIIIFVIIIVVCSSSRASNNSNLSWPDTIWWWWWSEIVSIMLWAVFITNMKRKKLKKIESH